MPSINIDKMFASPDQPRKHFCRKALEELSLSIKENGLLEPIVVPPRGGKYIIVAGERRYRACRLAGLKEAHARIIKADDRKVAELALLENLQREDLNPIEEALGYKKLMGFGMSAEDVAKKMGMKQTWRIRDRLDLLKLDPVMQKYLVSKFITPSQAFEMSRLPHDKQFILYEKIREGKADSYNKLRSLASALLVPPPTQVVFGGEASENEISIGKKYDTLVNRLVGFVTGAFDRKDLKVLAKVTRSTVAVNITKIDMVINELKKIQRAMIQAQSAKEVL